MKRNRMMRIASFLLLAVLATTCAISGTFAKYTSDFTGTDTARVAKWAFSFKNGTAENATGMTSELKTFAFDLFATVGDTDAIDDDKADDNQVENGVGDDHIIAPGTEGSFKMTIINNSEVTAQYVFVLLEEQTAPDGKKIPIKYRLSEEDNWVTYDQITATATLTKGQQSDITVYWQWAFSTDAAQDANDTFLGWDGQYTVATTAKFTATQVD